MSTETQSKPAAVIVVFKESVSKEQIQKYADDIVANGGIVKDRYYESAAEIIHGFSATIPVQYLTSFKSFQGDNISYIEPDKTVTIQSQ